jgi:outer membrane protein
MKRVLIFILLLTTILFAKDKKVTIGAGIYTQSQPYKQVKNLLLPSPVVFFDNGLFYVRWSRFGLYFLGEKKETYSWGFSLTAQPRTLGYKASDSLYLNGMEERKSTFEGGIAFSASFKQKQYIEVMLLADMLNRYNSWVARAEIGDEYKIGNFTFYPSIVLLYQPQKFLNYYYGVKTTEVTNSRPQYSPSGGLEYGAQSYIKYPLTKELSVLVNLRYDKLPKSATESPLIEKNYIYSGLFSLIYTFEY